MEIKDCKITVNLHQNRRILLNNQIPYEFKCFGILLKEGKILPRELTDEEKIEAEALKSNQLVNHSIR